MGRLADIEILVAITDHGSFTAAARALGISTSLASRRITALEARVGAPLLLRTTRSVRLTALGEAFTERCRTALELLDDAEHLAAAEQLEPRGRLRVSVPHTFGLRYLAPVVARWCARHPHVVADVSYSDRQVDLVDEGFDLAVRITSRLPDSDLVARKLATMETWVVASCAYLTARGEPSTPHDLRHHDALLYTLAGDPRRWTFATDDGPVTVPVDGRVVSDNGEALVAACVAGLGIATLPDWLVADDVRSGTLRRVLTDLPVQRQAMWALHPPHRQHAPKVQAFVDALAEAMDPVPWR